MKILYKINLLIITSVFSLIILFLVAETFKNEEIRYYSLVEGVKTVSNFSLNALVHEKNYEKKQTGEEYVYTALDQAKESFEKIDSRLLGSDSTKTERLSNILDEFRASFQLMTEHVEQLKQRKNKINELAVAYSQKNDEVSKAIDESIGNSFFNYTGEEIDTDALQDFKNSSLRVSTLINRIILLVNQELLLEGNVERFDEKYLLTIKDLGRQEVTLKSQASSLGGEEYKALGALLADTYKKIKVLTPELRNFYLENQKISNILQNNEQEISNITNDVRKLSERLRQEKNATAAKLKYLGQGIIIIALLIGGGLLGRSITSPLSILTMATNEMKPDQLDKLKSNKSKEEQKLLSNKGELGILARSFDKMRQAIIEKIELIEEYNRTLEEKIQERTAELRQKTNDIQNMLENMPEGIFTVLDDQTIHHEYSKYLETIFETDKIAGEDVIDLVFRESNLGADSIDQIKNGLAVIVGEDEMMFDMNSHIFPHEIIKNLADGVFKVLELDWNPILNEETDEVEKILVSVRDVTELRQLQEKANEQQRELEIIGQILSVSEDKFNDFTNTSKHFLDENELLITKHEAKDPNVLDKMFRNMHTIKGNARTYGFNHLTQILHEVEQEYVNLKTTEQDWDRENLLQSLQRSKELLEEYSLINKKKLGRETSEDSMEKYFRIRESHLENLLNRLRGVDHRSLEGLSSTVAEVRRDVAMIGSHALEDVLSGIHSSLGPLAKELNKEKPKVTVNDNDIVLKKEISPLLRNVCMHLYRNSMDHGLETPEERKTLGKEIQGHLSLDMRYESDGLAFTFKDDGRGLNLERIREKAIQNNVISEKNSLSDNEVAQLIFHSGLSTAEQVTEVSGRGVGMDAIKKFIEEANGEININLLSDKESTSKNGYRQFEIQFSLPPQYAIPLS